MTFNEYVYLTDPKERDAALENTWDNVLADILIDDDENILDDYEAFEGAPEWNGMWKAGTYREEIWHWFDREHSKGCAYLICK